MFTSMQLCNYKTIFKQFLYCYIIVSDTSQNFCSTQRESVMTYSCNRYATGATIVGKKKKKKYYQHMATPQFMAATYLPVPNGVL